MWTGIAGAQWQGVPPDTITSSGTTKYTDLQSLALDPSGHAHVTWRSASYVPTDFRVWYSSNSPDGVWSEPVPVSGDGANSPCIAYSAARGGPFLAFEEGEAESSEVFVAYRQAGTWTKERLTRNATFDRFSTIATDGDGRVHVAWIAQDTAGEYKLAYAWGLPGDWRVQRLETSVSPLLAYLAVTPQGVAHVSYRGGSAPPYRVHHAWNDALGGTSWQDEVVPSGNHEDGISSMALEASGGIHLVLGGYGPDFASSPRAVYYRHKPPSGDWTEPEFIALHAGSPSIEVAPDGRPHVVWAEMNHHGIPVLLTGRLFHSWREGADEWRTVPVTGDDAFGATLRIDPARSGQVVFSTGGNSGLYDVYHLRSAGDVTGVPTFEARDPPRGESPLLTSRPNPFTAHTTIRFFLRQAQPVSLKVYSPAGREIATIVSGSLPAGWHAREWAAGGLPAGVYFCRLSGPGLGLTRTLVRRD